MNNVKKKNCKIGTARHPLPVGLKYSRDPTTKGASPRSIIKCFFCTFCTLIVKLLGPSCLCLSQHWTLLEHARLAWLTLGSQRKKLPEKKNAWAWLTLGSGEKWELRTPPPIDSVSHTEPHFKTHPSVFRSPWELIRK